MRKIIYPLIAGLLTLGACDTQENCVCMPEKPESRKVNGAIQICSYQRDRKESKYLIGVRIVTPENQTVYFDCGEFTMPPARAGRDAIYCTPLSGRMDPETNEFEEFVQPREVDSKYLEGALDFCSDGELK